jgi:predicted ATPase
VHQGLKTRTRLFSPRALLARLEYRLPLLTGGALDLPARQQTLRRAIAWSYGLLNPAEQRLFRLLSVCAGGFMLEAALEMCAGTTGPDIDVLDGVASLAAKSLVRRDEGDDGEPRFAMLETIREYGLECLEQSGEVTDARRGHTAVAPAAGVPTVSGCRHLRDGGGASACTSEVMPRSRSDSQPGTDDVDGAR